VKKVIYLAAFLLSTVTIAQNESLFDQGNALYNDGKYAEAIDKYEVILNKGQHSGALYFNLGNAHYKLNNIAPSIYYYEKALQLSPKDDDIKNNRAFAKNMTIDDIEIIPKIGFTKVIYSITNLMSFDNWAKLSVILVLLFVMLILAYYFSYSSTKKRLAFMGSFLSILFACIALGFAFHKYGITQKDRPAIVFAKESKVKSEPNLRSAEAFILHEGTKVQILDTVYNWKKVKLTDGKTGWISSNELKTL